MDSKSNKINEVTGVIISRSLLEEYGYDGDYCKGKRLERVDVDYEI